MIKRVEPPIFHTTANYTNAKSLTTNKQPMNAKTTAITIASTAIHPKPTKTEIVEAMLQRALAKNKEENDKRKKIREALAKKIKAMAIKLAKASEPRVSIYARSKHCDVHFDRVTSPEMEALMAEYSANDFVYLDEKEARKAIRDQLNGTTKDPSRLLKNPEAVKAMDAMLAQWGI